MCSKDDYVNWDDLDVDFLLVDYTDNDFYASSDFDSSSDYDNAVVLSRLPVLSVLRWRHAFTLRYSIHP